MNRDVHKLRTILSEGKAAGGIQNTYYRVYARIDLDALLYNMEVMRRKMDPNAKIIAVVKTDGYGHGAVEIAHLLEELDYILGFAVATLEEALILRRHGIRKMILILGACYPPQFDLLIQNDISPTVYSVKTARELSGAAIRNHTVANIHIKVDTGMGRLGFLPDEEGVQAVEHIAKLPGLHLQGIFTHFAKADEADKSHAVGQLRRFQTFTEQLSRRGIVFEYRHCSNSAGILEMPQANMDAVRAGITMYGLYPSEEIRRETVGLRPVMGLFSQVVHLKQVPEGTTISYGGTFCTERTTVVATIPVGYGDGYPRSLSNCGAVLIRGRRAPIIGRICIDQFMVDVTDIPDAQCGDTVVLVGTDGAQQMTVEELSALSGRFPYEFVCDIGKRVPRAYYYDGELVFTRDYFGE